MIGEAKAWGTSLIGAPRGQRTPRQQLTEYLQLSQVDWGFLTEGRRWRLTHRSVAGRLDCYYEVDLVSALDAQKLDDFLYFYLFFRGQALRAPAPDQPCFLDEALGVQSQRRGRQWI